MNTYQVVENTTEPLDVQLLNDGVPFDGTNMEIEARIKSATGYDVPMDGKVEWLEPTTSLVRISPLAGDFLFAESPYQLRFVVTDIDSKTFAYPRFVAPDLITVGQP